MQPTPVDLARVPPQNLRVPIPEFVAAWTAAEQRAVDPRAADWYAQGLVDVFRWLAGATVRPEVGPWFAAPAPVSGQPSRAIPETIEAEWRFVQSLAATSTEGWERDRAKWLDGVISAFGWAWQGSGAVPVSIGILC